MHPCVPSVFASPLVLLYRLIFSWDILCIREGEGPEGEEASQLLGILLDASSAAKMYADAARFLRAVCKYLICSRRESLVVCLATVLNHAQCLWSRFACAGLATRKGCWAIKHAGSAVYPSVFKFLVESPRLFFVRLVGRLLAYCCSITLLLQLFSSGCSCCSH
jgi:hypothetical protein